MAPFVLILRWCLIIGLWVITVGATIASLGALAPIFTGDEQFGALDGFQFTGTLYQAVFRGITALIAALLLIRVLRWRPSRPEPGCLDPDEGTAQKNGDAKAEPSQPFKGRPRAWVIPDKESVDD